MNVKELAITATLAVLIIVTRLFVDTAPNIEFVSAAFVAAGLLIKAKHTAPILLIALLLTDILLGIGAIQLFTWSAFLGIYLMSGFAKKRLHHLQASVLLAVTATVAFFLWTNLGVVLVSNLYPQTFAGLMQSYINAIPFLQNQLAGNLVIVPIVVTLVSVFTEDYAVAKSGLGEPETSATSSLS